LWQGGWSYFFLQEMFASIRVKSTVAPYQLVLKVKFLIWSDALRESSQSSPQPEQEEDTLFDAMLGTVRDIGEILKKLIVPVLIINSIYRSYLYFKS
jgi:hypothetical protein